MYKFINLGVSMKRLMIPLLIILMTPALQAAWFETQGEAVIINGNKQQAKSQAVENALKKALLVAGANVSSVRQVVNGMLTEDNLSVRASGNVQSLELLSEIYESNVVTVTIRADIFPQLRQCFSADYKKPIAITRSYLKHREQANIGGIYAIDQLTTATLSASLDKYSQFAQSKVIVNKNTNFQRIKDSLNASKLKDLTTAIADVTDSQYVLFTEISDVSFGDKKENTLLFWQDDIFQRYYSLTVYLYNGVNGEQVFEKNYSGSAPWKFNKRTQVDLQSLSFWQSEYGMMTKHIIEQVTTDIDQELMCEPTRAKILSVNGDSVTFNMGSEHGVKVGDEFSLMHIANSETNDGKMQKHFRVSPYKVKVIQLTRTSAVASTQNELIGNIQINDIAVKH